jgi:CheY-like chemotaxis protein/anti-sigma regulatory factor (Ser/Thr protein kinase)
LKSRFLSNMTHEFRTPVNAIIGLCNLLTDDREQEGRTPEPEIDYIRKAADQLSDLVNDLLDLAKVEAGKTVVRPAAFRVESLFGALRGMLKPVLLNQSIGLVFEDSSDLPALFTDEAKVSQVLRNLLSNALKFTERGEVRVRATVDAAGKQMTFTVSDTGIGIAAQDQTRIFEEFAQLENRLQRKVQGTGLGLPLSRRLAELLGGTLTVTSEPGRGSTFSLTIPVTYSTPDTLQPAFVWEPDPARYPLLVLEDAPNDQFLYDKIFRQSQFQLYPAYNVNQAEKALEVCDPAAIIMDLVLAGEEAWDFLVRLKRDERSRHIPIVIVSAVARQDKALALGADAYLVKPIERRALFDTIAGLQARTHAGIRVLSIDDDAMSRYLLRQCLTTPIFEVIEASNGEEGHLRARSDRPDVILLDLIMPEKDGRETLGRSAPRSGDARYPGCDLHRGRAQRRGNPGLAAARSGNSVEAEPDANQRASDCPPGTHRRPATHHTYRRNGLMATDSIASLNDILQKDEGALLQAWVDNQVNAPTFRPDRTSRQELMESLSPVPDADARRGQVGRAGHHESAVGGVCGRCSRICLSLERNRDFHRRKPPRSFSR